MRDYCKPMADVPMHEVKVHHVHACLSPIWETKNRTAVRLKERINLVLDHAQSMECHADNPVEKVVRLLPKVKANTQHLDALPHKAIAEAVRKVRGANHATQDLTLGYSTAQAASEAPRQISAPSRAASVSPLAGRMI